MFCTISLDDFLELSGVGLGRVQVVNLKLTGFQKGLRLQN